MSFMARNPDLKQKYSGYKERDHFFGDILKVERLLVEEFISAHRVTFEESSNQQNLASFFDLCRSFKDMMWGSQEIIFDYFQRVYQAVNPNQGLTWDFNYSQFLAGPTLDLGATGILALVCSCYFRSVRSPSDKGTDGSRILLAMDRFEAMLQTLSEGRFNFDQTSKVSMSLCEKAFNDVAKWDDKKFQFVDSLIVSILPVNCAVNTKNLITKIQDENRWFDRKIGQINKILETEFIDTFPYIKDDVRGLRGSLAKLEARKSLVLQGGVGGAQIDPNLELLIKLWAEGRLAYLCESGFYWRFLMAKIELKSISVVKSVASKKGQLTISDMVQILDITVLEIIL